MNISCEPRWDSPCIVAATGSSLTKQVAAACRGYPTLALKQAWIRLPWAEALYACDAYWWNDYKGVPQFKGEKWSSHHPNLDNKIQAAKQYKLRLVAGEMQPGFSLDPSKIHYGPYNSGFQAINLAIHWLRKPGRIVLVGFDFQGGFFFGRHPRSNQDKGNWTKNIPAFKEAANMLPPEIDIVNASPNSALKCFPAMSLEEAVSGARAVAA